MSLALEEPRPLVHQDVQPHNGRSEYRKRINSRLRIGGQVLLIWLVLNYQRIIAPVGRRFGKTTGLLFIIPELAGRTSGTCYVGIWSSDNDKAKELMETFITGYGGDPKDNPSSLISKVKRSEGQVRYIELRPIGTQGHSSNTGTRIYFWSAEAYNRIRGFTHPFHLIVSDESSYVRANAVLKVSLKMLADCGGKFLAIGTPDIDGRGFAWFSTFWARAMSKDPKWVEWAGMNFPSEANPTISLRDIATMRAECMTKEEEKQEIDAEFLQDTSSVFGDLNLTFEIPFLETTPGWAVESMARSKLDESFVMSWVAQHPLKKVPYVMGVDWGRKHDETVITQWRQDTAREVARFAISGQDWDEQMAFVVNLRRDFGDCSIRSDAHGVGDGMTLLLQKQFGEDVTAVTWAGNKKEKLVRTLSSLMASRAVRLINAHESREQFRIYHGERSPRSGKILYSAPDNEHDDHVDATLCVVESIMTPTVIDPTPDGAEVHGNQPKPGTMAELRAQMHKDWDVEYIQECQI